LFHFVRCSAFPNHGINLAYVLDGVEEVDLGNAMHLVLLGDSVFDNGLYVPGRPPVAEQIRAALPGNWQVTLLAVDGNVAVDVIRHLERLPFDATHLAISTGGNDALRHSGVLFQPTSNVGQALSQVANIQEVFRRDYRSMLTTVRARRLPTIVCTIYDAIPGLGREASAALSFFNDVIVHEAAGASASILDLRLVSTEARHFSEISPIEPSAAGGERIAEALARAVLTPDFGRQCVIYS
jgi:GDSL-like lipase/acylhydrolase family protein